MKQEQPGRSGRLDAIRGVALVLMVVFHFGFLLRVWYGYDLPWIDSVWFGSLGGTAALLFFLVSGVSSQFSFSRSAAVPPSTTTLRFLRRSSRIWIAASLITLFTAFFLPEQTVLFGTLHFLAISNLLLLPLLFFIPLTWFPTLALSAAALGMGLSSLRSPSASLLIFGIAPSGFRSLDYYPLLPWIAVPLCGAWLGKQFRQWLNADLPRQLGWLSWLGRRSLLVYLAHVPFFVAVIELWRIR